MLPAYSCPISIERFRPTPSTYRDAVTTIDLDAFPRASATQRPAAAGVLRTDVLRRALECAYPVLELGRVSTI